MTDIDLLKEEIAELEAQIRRLKGSMQRTDNGEKLRKLAIINRMLDRTKADLAKLSRGQAA